MLWIHAARVSCHCSSIHRSISVYAFDILSRHSLLCTLWPFLLRFNTNMHLFPSNTAFLQVGPVHVSDSLLVTTRDARYWIFCWYPISWNCITKSLCVLLKSLNLQRILNSSFRPLILHPGGNDHVFSSVHSKSFKSIHVLFQETSATRWKHVQNCVIHTPHLHARL